MLNALIVKMFLHIFAIKVLIYINMTKYSELVYMVTDLLKLFSDDSTYTEDHIIYLLESTRAYLLEQKYGNDSRKSVSYDNLQTIEVTLTSSNNPYGIDTCYSNGYQYKSKCKIPSLMRRNFVIVKLKDNLFSTLLQYVAPERFEYVGFNRFTNKNMAFCTIGNDGYLYVKTASIKRENDMQPIIPIGSTLQITSIFGSPKDAAVFKCDSDTCKTDSADCDILEKPFPIESELIYQLIEIVVTKLAQAIYKPADPQNNATDDMASIQTFIRQMMKDKFVKETQS